jgi:hypothetical protein
MPEKVVYVAHCIDSEGPLQETLESTFERLRSAFGIALEPTAENLRLLQNKKMPLGGAEEAVALMLKPENLAYHETWEPLDAMLRDALSPAFRRRFPDSYGNGWVYNWHCVDHVGYELNPRRRDMGYHNIFDHYRAMLRETGSDRDGLHFHYHPMPFNRQAHCCATHYFAHFDTLYQILARRIIDRGWFPCVNRPGFHVTRPDSHWFLEQFIPFDYANQSCASRQDQPDLAGGRFGDWRRAPATWQPYHPSHDDYQTPGDCRRWVMRCLNVGTRVRLIRPEDVDQVFAEAAAGKPVILSVTNHDFRDIRPDVETVHAYIVSASRRHPDVKYRFCEARDAVRLALGFPANPPARLEVDLRGNLLRIRSEAPIFGPQPFFAVKTLAGSYYHDNLDFQTPFREWTYTFDGQTFPINSIEAIGVAAGDATGNVTVTVIRLPQNSAATTRW